MSIGVSTIRQLPQMFFVSADCSFFMQSGRCCLMLNLWKFTNMECWSNAEMDSGDGFSLGFLLIPLTIQSGMSCHLGHNGKYSDHNARVALTCIRFLGQFPCPTCLVQKAHVPEMGSKRDAARRQQERQDTEQVQSKISRARSWIFERGYRIGSSMIKGLLDSASLLPCRVSTSIYLAFQNQ